MGNHGAYLPMALREIPHLSAELVAALNERFPERCPDLNTTEREIWAATGRREVVRFLLNEFEKQNRNILTNKE